MNLYFNHTWPKRYDASECSTIFHKALTLLKACQSCIIYGWTISGEKFFLEPSCGHIFRWIGDAHDRRSVDVGDSNKGCSCSRIGLRRHVESSIFVHYMLICLFFKGVHSIERSAQEDTLLVLFNTAISNLVWHYFHVVDGSFTSFYRYYLGTTSPWTAISQAYSNHFSRVRPS